MLTGLPHSAAFPSLSSHSARPCCIASRCCHNSRSTSSTLGLVFPWFHGGGSHQSTPTCPCRANCNSRSAVRVTNSDAGRQGRLGPPQAEEVGGLRPGEVDVEARPGGFHP